MPERTSYYWEESEERFALTGCPISPPLSADLEAALKELRIQKAREKAPHYVSFLLQLIVAPSEESPFNGAERDEVVEKMRETEEATKALLKQLNEYSPEFLTQIGTALRPSLTIKEIRAIMRGRRVTYTHVEDLPNYMPELQRLLAALAEQIETHRVYLWSGGARSNGVEYDPSMKPDPKTRYHPRVVANYLAEIYYIGWGKVHGTGSGSTGRDASGRPGGPYVRALEATFQILFASLPRKERPGFKTYADEAKSYMKKKLDGHASRTASKPKR